MPQKTLTLRSLLLHTLALASIVLLPSLVLGVPVWRAERTAKVYLLLTASAYAVCSVFLMLRRAPEGRWVWLTAPAYCVLALSPLTLLAVLPAAHHARVTLFIALALAAALLMMTHWLRRPGVLQSTGIAALAVAAAVGTVSHLMLSARMQAPPAEITVSFINSSLYPLQFSLYQHEVDPPRAQGGALALLGDRFLLATGEGIMYAFREGSAGAGLEMQPLPYRVPLNLDEFAADAAPEVRLHQFRVTDILIQERGDTVRLYASHHFWHRNEKCFVVKVSVLEGSRAQLLGRQSGLQWKTLFESSPCLPVKLQTGEVFFNGVAAGGRLALLDGTHLMLTVGDHEFDGLGDPVQYSQNPDVSYGKTLVIDADTGAAEVFSLGHRNPQGLYVDSAGAIWSTEHGPQGGDELNRIERGRNYGWPIVTYGVNYGRHDWPNSDPGTHVGFERPRFAWVPAVGISNLTGITHNLFAHWRGDLIVGALVGHGLWRVRIRDNRVVLAEPIGLGERIRDVLEAPDGRLVVWTDRAAIGFLEPAGQPNSGTGLFAAYCGGCHAIGDGASHGIGPDLHAVLGRRIGRAAGFGYSPALRGKSGKWDGEALNAFLANPALFAPGTSMQFPGIPDAAERGKIVAFLAEAD
jgi:aldose sugar dehydrogenase